MELFGSVHMGHVCIEFDIALQSFEEFYKMRFIIVIFHFSRQTLFDYFPPNTTNSSVISFDSLKVYIDAISEVLIEQLLNLSSYRRVSHFFIRVCAEFLEDSICLKRAQRFFH